MRSKLCVVALSATLLLVTLIVLRISPSKVGSSSVRFASLPSRSLYQNQQKLLFEKNAGQAEPDVEFIARSSRYDLSLSRADIVFTTNLKQSKTVDNAADPGRVSLSILGASDRLKLTGAQRQRAVVNYYVGTDPNRWLPGVPTFAEVRYQNVYPGIDLVFHGSNVTSEFDFEVAPGSDPRQIRLEIAGPYSITEEGDLLLGRQNWIRVRKPRTYQIVEGREREVAANFTVAGGELGLVVDEYDPSRGLVIDPVVLYQGFVPDTTTGGWNFVKPSVAADPTGNVYLNSLASGGTRGPFNCVVTKLDPTGTMLYQTVYGPLVGAFGSCVGIAADSSGNAYFAGTGSVFPSTPGVVEPTMGVAFAAKLTTTGQVSYSTHIGGSGQDQVHGIAVDANGDAYLTGSTTSNDFPVVNPFQSKLNGPSNAYVSVLDPTASAFVYSTYLGGSAADGGDGIAVDSMGEAYVTGLTSSSDFPLKNPLQPTCSNTSCSFLTKFDSSGAALVYSTYLNLGTFILAAPSIALDTSGNAFVGIGNSNGAILVSIAPSGSSLRFSDSMPGQVGESIGVGVDQAENAYIGGTGSIPVLNPLQPSGTSFVASFTNSGTPIYATPVDGSLSGLTGAKPGDVYIIGIPGNDYYSVNLNQPQSGTPFISKISTQDAPALAYTPPLLAFGYQPVGVTSQPESVTLKDLGTTTLDLNSIVVSPNVFALSNSTCGSTLPPAGAATCSLSVTFTPVDLNPVSGAITITDNSMGSPHAIPLSGQGAAPAVGLNPTSLMFPNTVVSQSSQPEAVTLTNTGHSTLMISRIDISGDFSETNSCGSTVDAGGNCSIYVTFTPTALGNRTGTVTITDNASNSAQTVPLSGTGVSGGLNLQVPSGGSNSATVQAGNMATYQLSIGGAGFSGVATLTCSGAPSAANCSVPSSINVSGNSATPFNVKVSTMSRTMGSLHPPNLLRNWLWATTLACVVFLPATRPRKHLRIAATLGFLMTLLLLMMLLLLASSCGGGGSTSSGRGGTPTGTYQLTVTATSGNVNQSIPLTLIVQ